MAGTINKPKKPTSKRQNTRLRNKIQKASAAKQRKEKKKAKQNPQWRSKLKKDPGIPNLFPYKEKVLEEIEENRMRKQAEAQKRREMAKAAKTGVVNANEDEMADAERDANVTGAEEDMMIDADDDDGDADESNPMAALLASARAAAEQYDQELQDDAWDDDEESDEEPINDPAFKNATSRKAYDKVFKHVVEQADVVLYVLDARDPEGTRSREVERSVMAAASGGKRLVLVVNKIDLIPPKALKDWLAHLRRYFPTLPLRASTPAPNAHTFNHKELTVQKTSSDLFRALKSYAASKDLKRAISVGVIGYPNVGKSSVINALLGRLAGGSGKGANASKACPAGAEAGVTTSIRAVKIDSKLTLLDSPGIVFPSSSSTSTSGGLVNLKNAAEARAHLVLLNAVPPKQIDDPVPAVQLLLKRLSASPELMQKLTAVYDLPPLLTGGDPTTDFLVQVARKRGRLGRGGVPNTFAAAMTVVTDWRDGRIQGWVEPPRLAVSENTASASTADGQVASDDAPAPDQKVIVTEWAKEFKLDGLWGDGGEDVTVMEH